MVPPAFTTYFATIAGAGAALVGLLFIAISIAPESTVRPGAPLERQAMAGSCFIALCNPFLISLIALIPNLSIDAVGVTALTLSAAGLLNTFTLGWFLLREPSAWRSSIRKAAFMLLSLGLYGGQFYVGLLLTHAPNSAAPITALATLQVGHNVFGLSRSWDLLGAHRYRLQDLLKPEHGAENGQTSPEAGSSPEKESVAER